VGGPQREVRNKEQKKIIHRNKEGRKEESGRKVKKMRQGTIYLSHTDLMDYKLGEDRSMKLQRVKKNENS